MKFSILDKGQNKIEVEFNDISSEQFRTYEFSTGSKVRIEKPKCLYVSASGGHRLVDEEGISHYIPSGWIHLWWKVKDGEPYFVR